jgi:glutathionylspermidine synthase
VKPVTESKKPDRENKIAKFNSELLFLDKTDNLIESAFKLFAVSFIAINIYEIEQYPGLRPSDFLNDLVNTLARFD